MKKIQSIVGEISSITLENEALKVELLSYGASIFHLFVKTPEGLKEVSVQPNDINAFLTSDFYYGKTVGRTAGRIFGPSYTIDDVTHVIDGNVLLHSGESGVSFKHFDIIDLNDNQVTFQITSYEEDGPYDGDMVMQVTYLIKGNSLLIKHHAKATKKTLCNMTNHVYLNLDQHPTISNQHIQIHSHHYLNIDDQNKVISKEDVKGTPFDFNTMSPFKHHLDDMMETSFKGFDHTFLFHDEKKMVVTSEDLKMTLETSYPAVVLYTHNKVSPHQLINQQVNDNRHIAFTIECQYEPGGIQVDGLNDAILMPGESYDHFIQLTFEGK